MADKQYRIDYAAAPIEIVDTLESTRPTADRSVAIETPEGYLIVDAYIARDGLLRYSDGEESWLEYRPTDELRKAAASWSYLAVTDDHPKDMLDASNWTKFAKGVHFAIPTVEGPDPAGIHYLRARLLICDKATVAKIQGGKRELSIGFRALIQPTEDGVAFDGTAASFVQLDMEGNHTASVDKGRAGPRIRVLLDGAEIPVYHGCDHMADTKSSKKSDQFGKEPNADELGAPQESATLVGPDGQEIQVPGWLASMVSELEAMKAAQAPAPAPPAPPMPPAPAVPAVSTPDAAPPAAPVLPEEEQQKVTADDISQLVRKRARLTRIAADAGVASDLCDTADDVTLARAYVAVAMPHAKARADAADGDVLDALVEVAASLPAPKPNPFERSRAAVADAAPDSAELEFLKRQGY